MVVVELFELNARNVAFAIVTGITAWVFYRLILYPSFISSVRNVPGPPVDHLFSGNLAVIFKAEPEVKQAEWVERYGQVVMYRGLFGQHRLYVSDPKALNHILLQHPYDWPKPEQVRLALGRALGHGILFVEGDDHKRQRKILNGPFTQASVNSYLPIFQQQADKLRDRLKETHKQLSMESSTTPPSPYQILDMHNWISRATLDVIGLAGFDYAFNSLDDQSNELADVIKKMLSPRDIKLWMLILQFLIVWIPWLRYLPTTQAKAARKSLEVIEREGDKMLKIRMQAAENGELEEKKDLMSLIVKANLRTSEKRNRLKDHEIKGQVTTFVVAGHETSSTNLIWMLLLLSQNLDIQEKLRQEIKQAKAQIAAEGRDEMNVHDIGSLKYLDAFHRESMRFVPPVVMTARMSAKDDVVPLSEPITGRDGRKMDAINVSKGQQVMIGIKTMNKSEAVFGKDAKEFRPERWLEEGLEERLSSTKGFTAWSHQLSFLGGPRGCIGYRFALLEVKTILIMLLDNFEFLERDEGGTEMTSRFNIVSRPLVKGEEHLGARFPMRVRVLDQSS